MLSWLVRYQDQKEYKNVPNVFTWKNIDKNQLDAFVIFDTITDLPVFTLHIDDPRKRLIYVRRVELPNAKHSYEIVCHIVGFQMNVNGENIQSINYIFEANGITWIESAGKYDVNRNDWFYPPSEKRCL